MISLIASFCPPAPMVRLSWVNRGLARYCIVPDRAAADVPEIRTWRVEANELTCVACFAARASALPGETGCSGWAGCPPPADPQPAARATARQPAVLAASRRRDDEEERIGPCLLNRRSRVHAGVCKRRGRVLSRTATYASPPGEPAQRKPRHGQGPGSPGTRQCRRRRRRHRPVRLVRPGPPTARGHRQGHPKGARVTERKLAPGDKAPDFTLPDADGRPVSLSSLRGKQVIVYFYPAAMTPGCTTEACDFRDNLSSLAAAGVTVLGVSPDGPAKLARFRERDHLTFPLLSDPDHQGEKAYGAYGEKKLYGKTTTGVIRSTFVIDPNGVVTRAYYNVKATGHVARLRADLGL